MKVYCSDARVTVAAPMPGLEPQDVSAEVKDGSLVLHGDLRGPLKGEKDVVLDERAPGPYHREVRSPDSVDWPTANVTYNNGVVVIALPRTDRTASA